MRNLEAKLRKYQGVFEVKNRVKTWQIRGIWSQEQDKSSDTRRPQKKQYTASK